jgi:NitT/TauT family transport system substrate-binding protein
MALSNGSPGLRWRSLLAAGVVAISVAGCGAQAAPATPAGASTGSPATVLRLGYFPNVTHATAIVGVADGVLEAALGDAVTLEARTFNAGPDVVEAIFSGALDASYIGPNPAINAFIRSEGEAVRIIAGATSGGAFLVVRDGIDSVADLRGAKIATPQLGNTQDVALRAWLAEQGLRTDPQGGGDVAVLPQGNSQSLETFVTGEIDGAWVPEPWATRLIREGQGRVLVDERDLWPGGEYVTTHLIVATRFLDEHPDVVKRLLVGHLEATDRVNQPGTSAQATVIESIGRITGSSLSADVLGAAWQNLTFTVDPIASSLQESAADAQRLGFLPSSDLEGIYALDLLNEVLREAGRPEITQP